MRKFAYLLIVSILLVSCSSAEKLMQKGYYDSAIDKSIKKVMKGKAKDEDKELLDKAFKLANEQDEGRIDFLMEEARPENWDEIYRRYNSMNNRQTKMQRVLPLTINGNQVNYAYIDYNTLIVEAKTNAAKYFYTKGKSQMELNSKKGYRQAYFNFQRARDYRASDFPDIDVLLKDAHYFGTSRVLLELDAHLPIRLPGSFYDEVFSINTSGLNGNWVEYHLAPLDKDTYYDYYITIVLRKIIVDPPIVKTEEFMRRKRVKDGFEYVKDSRGNVMKDSLGNDIKVPKYKDLACTIIETNQYKAVTVKGEIEYVSANPDRLIKKIPIAGTTVFEHLSGKAIGQRDALLPEDWKLLEIDELPFPNDMQMLMDCAPILQAAITDAIHNNRNLVF